MHKIINNLIMDDLDVILKVKVSNGKNDYTIFTGKDKVTIEEIKRECIKKFNLPEKEMNNISLLYKDEDIYVPVDFDISEIFNTPKD